MVFDTKENTVCMVQLPVSLPDVRLRGRLADEEQLLGEMPPVAAEPPWNCDLLPRISAQSLMEQGEQPPMAAESDVPGLAETLITAEVRRETLRHKVPGWRIHGRDLIFVSLPNARAGLPNHEAIAVVSGLAAIAGALPVEVLDRFRRPWSGGPLVR
jgi:hypothetical protein